MSAQHTPGPWTRDGFGFLVGSTGEQVLLADSGLGFASGANHPERYANARLAAAAPKRLKALQSIVASLVEHDDEGMIEHAEQMIAARAALAMMDRLEDYYRRHEVLIGPVDDAYSVEHKAARLAAAELIEAAAALCGAIEFRIDDPRNALRDRAVMALAGCGGAK